MNLLQKLAYEGPELYNIGQQQISQGVRDPEVLGNTMDYNKLSDDSKREYNNAVNNTLKMPANIVDNLPRRATQFSLVLPSLLNTGYELATGSGPTWYSRGIEQPLSKWRSISNLVSGKDRTGFTGDSAPFFESATTLMSDATGAQKAAIAAVKRSGLLRAMGSTLKMRGASIPKVHWWTSAAKKKAILEDEALTQKILEQYGRPYVMHTDTVLPNSQTPLNKIKYNIAKGRVRQGAQAHVTPIPGEGSLDNLHTIRQNSISLDNMFGNNMFGNNMFGITSPAVERFDAYENYLNRLKDTQVAGRKLPSWIDPENSVLSFPSRVKPAIAAHEFGHAFGKFNPDKYTIAATEPGNMANALMKRELPASALGMRMLRESGASPRQIQEAKKLIRNAAGTYMGTANANDVGSGFKLIDKILYGNGASKLKSPASHYYIDPAIRALYDSTQNVQPNK